MRYLLTLLLLTTATQVNAQQTVCGNRTEIVKRLESRYDEKASALGLAATGGVIELFTSEKGTFTLMITQPNGVSCLVAAGDNWETVKPNLPAY